MCENHRKNGLLASGLLAKSDCFRKPQFGRLLESCHESISMKVILGQLQHVAPRTTHQARRQHQKIRAHGLYSCCPVRSRQAQSPEPMHQVAREKHELKKRYIGHPVSRGDLAQRQIVKQFADVLLDDGAWLIKFPDAPRLQVEIGDEHTVAVATVLEECQLFGLDRVLRYRTAHHHKAPSLGPAVGLVSKLGHLEPALELVEARRPRALFDWPVFFGDDNIAQALIFQAADELAAEESRVGPNPDAPATDMRGHLGQATLKKENHSSVGRSIARSQRAVPKLLAIGLEAQQRVIRAAAFLFGIVANPGFLLMAIEGQDHGVQIEDQTGGSFGEPEELAPQLVVQTDQLADGFDRQTLQKPAQRGLIWKTTEPEKIEEGSVVLQQLGLVDAAQPGDRRVEQSQDQVGRTVVGVALRQLDLALEPPPQVKLLTKTVHKHQAAKVRQMLLVERKAQCSQGFWHRRKVRVALSGPPTQSSLKVKFVAGDQNRLPILQNQYFSNESLDDSRIFEVETVKKLRDPDPTPLIICLASRMLAATSSVEKNHVYSEAPVRINGKLRQGWHGTRRQGISAGIMPLLTELEKRSKPAFYRHGAPKRSFAQKEQTHTDWKIR